MWTVWSSYFQKIYPHTSSSSQSPVHKGLCSCKYLGKSTKPQIRNENTLHQNGLYRLFKKQLRIWFIQEIVIFGKWRWKMGKEACFFFCSPFSSKCLVCSRAQWHLLIVSLGFNTKLFKLLFWGANVGYIYESQGIFFLRHEILSAHYCHLFLYS